jgi:cysteine desulfurase/selenocysteine lyase
VAPVPAPLVTDIAYHPTRLRALRDSFRALRAAEFPWTADTVYLNNASIGPIPERTRRALDAFTAKRTAPHLLPDRELQGGLEAARHAIARLINAEPGEIALTTNTSFGLNVAARALPLRHGDIVVVSDREFPANVYPWLLLKKQGIEVELAPCGPEGWPDEDYLVERLHDPRVRVLAVSFVQFSNGYRADLGRLGAACRANGTFLVVDGIQGVGNSVLDVRETPVDILACGGQKWLLSPWGSGFLYVRRELVRVLEPAMAGWMAFEGTDDFSRLTEYNPTFRSDARRFEMVTLPYQDFYGMTTSVSMLCDLGVRDIAEHTRALHEAVWHWADAKGVRVASARDDAHRSAIVCLAPERPAEAFHAVKRARIVCSLREGAIRLSPHCYNTVEEMGRVVDVLDGLQ